MRRHAFVAMVIFGACVTGARAQMIGILEDSLDDRRAVVRAEALAVVEPTRAEIESLRTGMLRWKEPDFKAMFGPGDTLPAGMAMPIAQARGVALPGIRYADEKKNLDHTEVYAIGTIGYAEVMFGIDGNSPAAVIFYLRPDADFVRLTDDGDAVGKRLAWDAQKLKEWKDWVADRWRDVYRYEVDAAKERELFAGEFSRDIKIKFAAWKALGEKYHWRFREDSAESPGGLHWSWYNRDDTLVREAYSGDELPNEFVWINPETRKEMRRESGGRKGYLASTQWSRLDGTRIRGETASHGNDAAPWRTDKWDWCDGRGKVVRVERDTNGDGVPDRFSVGSDGKEEVLGLDKSWAAHSELIPAESRTSDQEPAVPLREIPKRSGR